MHANPRILLIDSYDSFTFNLASLCKRSIPNCSIYIVKNDVLTFDQLLPVLSGIDAIVIGPGPGNPSTPKDVGVIPDLLDTTRVAMPIFGVCLGMQCMGLMGGATLRKLKVVKHGLLGRLVHCARDLFEGVGDGDVVRYHSFCVDLPPRHQDQEGELEELAYLDDGEDENGKVLMALRHRSKPFWGVQYHPESILTTGAGDQVLANFWNMARLWNETHRQESMTPQCNVSSVLGPAWPGFIPSPTILRSLSTKFPTTPIRTEQKNLVHTTKLHTPALLVPSVCEYLGVLDESKPFVLLDSAASPGKHTVIGCITPGSVQITYRVGDGYVEVRSPSSGSTSVPPGGATGACTERLGGRRPANRQHCTGGVERYEFEKGEDVWGWLDGFMSERRFRGGEKDVPFWGGLIGCISYEAGVDELDVSIRNKAGYSHPDPSSKPRPDMINVLPHPDLNLIYIERSIVIDTLTETTYIQTLLPGDEEWTESMEALLHRVASVHLDKVDSAIALESSKATPVEVKTTLPDKETYIQRIKDAKEYLFSGESYELCVTGRAEIFFPPSPPSSSSLLSSEPTRPRSRALQGTSFAGKQIQPSTSWIKYKTLRASNPAPFAGYIRLHPTTLLSTSPERFLSYSRPGLGKERGHQVCELRPIKGTLRKVIPSSSPSASSSTPSTGQQVITREMAEKLLRGSDKEVAENLMIVDLIRHDLAGVLGDCVSVEKFCGVEEYRTVWQMVSVIQGTWRGGDAGTDGGAAGMGTSANEDDAGDGGPGMGWRVLRQSLPPGSMTGAPKKRSVDILQSLEDSPRSIYSGVFGYWCVSGGGDWSVTIRSCFKYDDKFVTPFTGSSSSSSVKDSESSLFSRDDDEDSTGNSTTSSSPRTAPSYHATSSSEEDLRLADESNLDDDLHSDAVIDAGAGEKWVLGAGGAITALSDPEAEWEEMILKLESVCRAFGAL